MAAGLGLAGACLALAAVVDSFAALLVALTAAGGFGACVQAASGRAVMAWFGAQERGMALGIRQTAVVVGGAYAALVLPPVTEAGGVRASLLVLAAGALLASLASAAFLRDPAGSGTRHPTSLRAALHDHYLWRLSGGSALLVVAQVSILGFAVLFLHDERGLSPAAAGGVVALMQVLGGVLRIASGRWSDRLGTRITPLLRIGAALAAALALSALVVGAPLVVLLPALVVAGSLSAGWNGLSFTAAAELAGQARAGAAIGLQQASLALAAAVTPVVFAAIVDQASWSVAFGFAGLVALLGTLALVPLAAREPLLDARG
jgi:sugar phosphate permease